MKRFASLALLAGILLFPSVSFAQGQKVIDLKFRTSLDATIPYLDSLTFSMNGAIGTTGTIDTTVWVDTREWDWSEAFDATVNTTASGFIKLWVYAPLFTSVDTVFVAMETSPDGFTPITNTTFVNMIVTTAGDEAVSFYFQADSDAGNLNLWRTPYIRFRIRADGNTGAVALSSRARLVVPAVQDFSTGN